MENQDRKGFVFKNYQAPNLSPFDKLFPIFKELITHTSGDFDEAIDWLRQLDQEYQLTDEHYTIDDFIEDLKKKGYIREELKDDGSSGIGISSGFKNLYAPQVGLDAGQNKIAALLFSGSRARRPDREQECECDKSSRGVVKNIFIGA